MIILGTNSIKDTGYDVANSCRFNDDDSAYLSRTQTSGSTTKFTYSAWMKRSKLGSAQDFLDVYDDNNNRFGFFWSDDDQIDMYNKISGSVNFQKITTAKYRDTSAWYNVIIAADTTLATAEDRIKLWVNGVRVTSFGTNTNPGSSDNLSIHSSDDTQRIGSYGTGGSDYDGYMAEVVWIDGTTYDNTYFGEFDSDSPKIWKPKDVSGLTFGNNGFHLDFEDSSALGNDVSGENHDFSVTNLASTDQATDTCTNNFATMNPLFARSNNVTFTEGNLKGALASEGNQIIASTIAVSAGKWYFEFQANAQEASAYMEVGIFPTYHTTVTPNYIGGLSDGYSLQKNGYFYNNNSAVATDGPTYGTSDIMGVALDLDSGTKTIKYYKNGSLDDGTTQNITVTEDVYIGWRGFGNAEALSMNFGSPKDSISSGNADGNGYGNFEYAVPSGYYSICTKNLAEFG